MQASTTCNIWRDKILMYSLLPFRDSRTLLTNVIEEPKYFQFPKHWVCAYHKFATRIHFSFYSIFISLFLMGVPLVMIDVKGKNKTLAQALWFCFALFLRWSSIRLTWHRCSPLLQEGHPRTLLVSTVHVLYHQSEKLHSQGWARERLSCSVWIFQSLH